MNWFHINPKETELELRRCDLCGGQYEAVRIKNQDAEDLVVELRCKICQTPLGG